MIRGYGWFIRNYGLRRLIRYERDRRAGMTIDYAKVFNADERAILEEHGLAPWSKDYRV